MAKNYNRETIHLAEGEWKPGFYECELSEDGACEDMCDTGTGSYICTRTAGHLMPHAAHGGPDVQYATWEDDDVVDT